MAFPAPYNTGAVATWDKTATTWGRSVDSKLWPALEARAPLLAYIPRYRVDHFEFEWETQNEPLRQVTCTNSTSTDIDGSGTGTTMVVSASGVVEPGMLLRNASRATPIGTYGVDEIMLATASTSGATVVVQRDYGNQNSGTGSAAHQATDVFDIIGNVKGEGSGPGNNRYRDVSIAKNWVEAKDFYLEVTGTQMRSKRLLAADNLAAQTKLGMNKLQREMESMFLYGCVNASDNDGSASQVRTTKGFLQWILGGNIDYTTGEVTPTALDNLFYQIIADRTDPSDRFIIVCHPYRAKQMSHFGEDTVRTTQSETVWGREITSYKSDLGITADIIWTLQCSLSDLFIIDLDKVAIAEFTPWMQTTVDYNKDMIDSWRQRVLGEYGVKVVDGQYSHAAMTSLDW